MRSLRIPVGDRITTTEGVQPGDSVAINSRVETVARVTPTRIYYGGVYADIRHAEVYGCTLATHEAIGRRARILQIARRLGSVSRQLDPWGIDPPDVPASTLDLFDAALAALEVAR